MRHLGVIPPKGIFVFFITTIRYKETVMSILQDIM